MFLNGGLRNEIFTEKYGKAINHLQVAGKNQFLCLFSWIRIEVHFPLEFFYPLIFFNSLFKSISEALILLTTEKSKVSSENNLGLDAKF